MNTQAVERRPVGALGRMGIVAGLHVAVVYLVATGLGIAPKLELPPDIKGSIIEEKVEPVDPPPPIGPPDPSRNLVVQFDPPVAPPVDATEDTNAIGGEFVPDAIPLPPIDNTAQSVLVGVRPDPNHALTRPRYPSAAIQNALEGAVVIEVFVLPSGRVGDARVVQSTGHALLDQAAVEEAKRRWRLLPATRDGVPYAQWHKFRVVFDLQNQ